MKPTVKFFLCFIFFNYCFFAQDALSQKSLNNNSTYSVNSYSKDKLHRCSTVQYEKYLKRKFTTRKSEYEFEKWLQPLIEKFKLNRSESGGIITIPVVVHVVHNGVNVGVAPNIDDLQVQSQIEVLNNDYRKKLGTPGHNTNLVGVDTEIQFALAKVDPNGNPTNGIDRVYYNHDKWTEDEIEEILKPQTIWNTAEYLNMWTVDFANSTLLGYAQFPDASGLPGLDTSGGLGSTDGVISNYAYFGSRLIYPNGVYNGVKYDKGRTMTHEIGHWLGLRHIWGDSTCGDDYCVDTPRAHGSNYDCPIVVNCDNTGSEMVENYMDYTDDSCMNIFTQNQKDRMYVIMNNANRRKSLKNSTKEQAITLFTNDAEVKIERVFVGQVNACDLITNNSRKVTITNRGTNSLNSVNLKYNINGGVDQYYNWIGLLSKDQSESFDLTVTANVNDDLNVSIDLVNGVVDPRISNNSASAKIMSSQSSMKYAIDLVTFKLQLDNYGSEVTWELKNKVGNVLYSGGPYSDSNTLPSLITQVWEVKNDECYTFTINDTANDGVCCTQGEGFYELSNKDVVIARGGNFGSTDKKSFTVEALTSSVNVVLRENPVNEELLFVIDKDFGKNIVCDIFDISGNKVLTFPGLVSFDINKNVSVLQSGMYFLRVKSDNKTITKKFIKN